jgi:hypothetical protein
MRPGAAPLWEQVITLIAGPPIMTGLWWLMSRGWAANVQGGTASEMTKRRQKMEFKILLIVMYLVGFGMLLYAWLT